MDKCNIESKEEEEEESYDVIYLVVKGVLKELVTEV